MNYLISFCFLLLSVSGFAQGAPKKYSLISIPEIKTTAADTFRIQGVVRSIFRCPSCPPGMTCKPCEGDHIVFGPLDAASKDFVKIFTKTPDAFRKGNTYVLRLTLHIKTLPEHGTNLILVEPSGR